MNEFDFAQLKNLKAPSDWVENAVNIPRKKQKPTPMFLRPQFIGSAAAVVLVTAAVLMTLLLQNGSQKPSFTPAPAIVTTAATEPPESEPPATTQANVQTTAATQATERETAFSPTEYEAGRVTAPAHAAPATSPQIPSASATAPATVPYSPTQAPTQAATQEPTQAPTQAPTQPATQPATQTATQTATEPEIPSEEVNEATEATAEPSETIPREIFYGSVTIRISPKCPLYQSKYLYIAVLDSSGRDCSHYTIVRKLTDGEMTFYPQNLNIYLCNGENYVLRLYDINGSERRAWFTPAGGNIEIKING